MIEIKIKGYNIVNFTVIEEIPPYSVEEISKIRHDLPLIVLRKSRQ